MANQIGPDDRNASDWSRTMQTVREISFTTSNARSKIDNDSVN